VCADIGLGRRYGACACLGAYGVVHGWAVACARLSTSHAHLLDDLRMIERNERRSMVHILASVTAVTVAARGREYMRASSPKQGFAPAGFGL
jgi:hypothetical protein